ncbi:recombinase family protein [Streptomyces sp. NPDC015237]|uniref:recombinase family protein n=1 Tax=Streptomyces sp. NPDC015237 TaxID=3364949 RepID=UPI0036F5B587
MPQRSHGPSPQGSIAATAPQQTRALGVLRISQLTEVTTAPDRQRATIHRCAQRLGLTIVAETADLGVSARSKSPFERPSLSIWLRHPTEYDAIVWSHVDRAVRSLAHMAELLAWARRHTRTLVFGGQGDDSPIVVRPQTDDAVIQRCMDLAKVAEQEAETLSARLTSSHAALRMIGRYGGGLVPFGYRKAPHPSGSGWCLAPDPEAAAVVHAIVADVETGSSLIAIARRLNDACVPVPRDRHAQLQGRPTGGRRHGRDFERFRWTSGTLSKVLRSPSLMGHRIHQGQTVRDGEGAPVLIGPPLLTEDEFGRLQTLLRARSSHNHHRNPTNAMLTAVAHCSGCDGRMYFAARKGRPHGDYACRATARGDVCSAPASMRSDWLESYTVARYKEVTSSEVPVTRELLLASGARVNVAKGRCGGGPARLAGPDTSRLSFTLGNSSS